MFVPTELLESNRVFIDRDSETTVDNAEAIIRLVLFYQYHE